MIDKTNKAGHSSSSTVAAIRSDGERVTLRRTELTRHFHNLPKKGSDVSCRYSVGSDDLEMRDDGRLFDPKNPSVNYRLEG